MPQILHHRPIVFQYPHMFQVHQYQTPMSEPILTPFQSIPIRNLITCLPCLTLISLYCFWYLRSGPVCLTSSCYSLDLVVCLPCLPFWISLHRYCGPTSNPCWTLFFMFLCHVTFLNMFLVQCHFCFGLLLVYVPMSPSLLSFVSCVSVSLISCMNPFCSSLMFPCFESTYIPCTPTHSLQLLYSA